MNNKSGFTLVEVIIVLGITCLFTIISMGTLKMMMIRKKRENAQLSQKAQIRELKKLAGRLKTISWPLFFHPESYFLKDSSRIEKVTWALRDTEYSSFDDITFSLEGGTTFRNSSHTIEIAGINLEQNRGKSVLFSRCVERGLDEQDLDFSSAYAINLVPMIAFQGKIIEIYCCPKGSICSDNKVVNSYSTHRVMSFFVQKTTRGLRLRRFPRQPFKRKEHGQNRGYAFDGVGVIFLFNKDKHPNNYNMYIFSQMNRCYMQGQGRECKGAFDTNYFKIQGNVLKSSVDETGLFEIR